MSKKKKNQIPSKRKRKANPKALKESILDVLESDLSKAFTSKQLIRKLKLREPSAKASVLPILTSLEKSGQVSRLRNSFRSTRESSVVTGRVDHVNSRYAYVVTPGDYGDVWVRDSDLHTALDGDLVEVIIKGKSRGARPEGKVKKILERCHTELVGRIEFSPRYAFVIPDNRKIHEDIFIPIEFTGQSAHNDKVLVKITNWPTPAKSAEGKVTRVLGKAGEHEAEMHSIMAEFNLPFEFPPGIILEAEKLGNLIDGSELKKRKDFRKLTTFTIDPVDAKDFDDALSYRKLANGNHEVGIHIADVTHYVNSKSLLEKEARSRATSVYLVDRTIPMLPERLSNQLCSLRPLEDKLTITALFELDERGKIRKEWFGKSVIFSDRRFTYEEVQEILNSGNGAFNKELTCLNQLAKTLRTHRFANGAVNFETTEVRFRLDDDGTPLEIIPKVRQDAHKLVEEFMLLANKQVANFVYHLKEGKEKNTFVYRTHDYPDPEKVASFALYANRFGHNVAINNGQIASSINQLIEDIEGKPEEDVLQNLAIRSMAKAIYTTEPKIHFGLAFKHYTHFTSPIRRYPDMMVHRLLQHYLSNGSSPNRNLYEENCQHSSDMEKNAADAERASIKYKQVEFMRHAEKKPYEGVVSGVTEWGIFVEIIETRCEGMVRMSTLTDDFYEYDEQNIRVVGRNNHRIISLGDKVNVRVIKTDIDRRTIDLTFV